MNEIELVEESTGIKSSDLSAFRDAVIWNALSKNTRRAYQHAYDGLLAWLNGRQLSDTLLAVYITELDKAGRTPQTIGVVVAAVKWWVRTKGIPIAFDLTNAKFKTIRRDSTAGGRGQVVPLRRDDVRDICRDARKDEIPLRGLRDIALFRVMRDGLLRISEAVAIDVEHIHDNALFVPRSKTDQEGTGVFLYLTAGTCDAINEYIREAGFEEGALFRTVFKHSVRRFGARLTVDKVREIIKKRAADAGITGRVSGHSFRVGSAIDLAQGNNSLPELQVAGRWKSPRMPAHYAGAVFAKDGAVANTFENDEF